MAREQNYFHWRTNLKTFNYLQIKSFEIETYLHNTRNVIVTLFKNVKLKKRYEDITILCMCVCILDFIFIINNLIIFARAYEYKNNIKQYFL